MGDQQFAIKIVVSSQLTCKIFLIAFSVFGPNLERTRRIITELGSNSVKIEDVVENIGWQQSPLMILFHINVGWPILGPNSEFIGPSERITPRDKLLAGGQHNQFSQPQPDYQEQVFFHDMSADNNNHVYVALVNRNFNSGEGIGLYVRYHKTQFPQFVQWKMLGESIYCVGLEPANCGLGGRATERITDSVEYLEPGGRRHYEVEIGVLTDNTQIDGIAD